MKILIAEDREEDRYLLEVILKNVGHHVIATTSGQEAWDFLGSQPVDLVISDILMPDMDGYMLCRHIRNHANLKKLPFIFVTATYLSESDEHFAMELGADAFIKKPVNPEEIYQTIAEVSGQLTLDGPRAKTISRDTEFAERHSRQILSALKSKSDELEDLVERLRKTQDALRRSEERYRLISTTTSDYIYALGLDERGASVVEWISGAFKKITGFDTAKIQTLEDWIAVVIPDDRDLFHPAARYALSPQKLKLEYRIKTASGEEKWLRDKSTPLLDKSKKVLGRVGAVQDMTRQKEDQIRLQRMATAVESAAESIMITDFEGYIQYVNPAFQTITGYSSQEVMGKNPSLLKSDKHGPQFYQQMWRTLKQGRVWRGNIVNKKKDGSLYEINSVISPIKNHDQEITNFISVRRDVTHERALEAQLRQTQKMEAIGTLAGGIAHDFNNILSAILGFTQVSMDQIEAGSMLHENLNEVMLAGYRARDLVQQILTFARQTEQEFKPVQLSLVVKEAVRMLRASLPSTIHVEFDIADETRIIGDASQLYQIIMNLCTNAAQAMGDSGDLRIDLKGVVSDGKSLLNGLVLKAGRYLEMSVRDTGCGMTEAQQEHIFEPFFTTKTIGEGTGLGLAVVHGIIENHGGAIKVLSEHHVGSTFIIYLPALAPAPIPVEDKTPEPLPTGDERILLVDDEPSIVRLGKQMLTGLGYRVTALESGLEALAQFKARPREFDLVISDLTMPDIKGDLLAQQILAVRPEVPVILCSGFAKPNLETEIKSIGVRALLMKPVMEDKIARMVRDVLDAPTN